MGYSRPYFSYSYWNHGRSYGSGGFSSALGFLAICVVIIVVVIVVRKIAQRASQSGGGGIGAAEKCDVSLVQLGVQIQARDIQDHLERLAEKIDPSSEEGLAYALRSLAQDLIAKRENIEYGGVEGLSRLSLTKAQDQFELWSANERAKFNREVIRGQVGGPRRQQKEWKTDGIRDEDGQLAVEEFFVISLVLATRGLVIQPTVQDHEQLLKLLEQLAGLRTEQLVALEVVWSPAAKSDAMGRDDMCSRYPEMAPI